MTSLFNQMEEKRIQTEKQSVFNIGLLKFFVEYQSLANKINW